jgi:hypothetical protein
MALLRAVWNRKGLWALQVVANAVLLALVWLWLSLPESKVWQLALSAVVAVVVTVGFLWLNGNTLAAFRIPDGTPPFNATLRQIPALLAWALVGGLLVAAALRLVPASRWTWLPGVAAVAVVLALLPAASQMSAEGLRGLFRTAAWSPLGLWQYYAAAIVCLAVGVLVPYKLIWWIPKIAGINGQAASAAVRFGIAYVLALTGWFLLAAAVSRLSARHGG